MDPIRQENSIPIHEISEGRILNSVEAIEIYKHLMKDTITEAQPLFANTNRSLIHDNRETVHSLESFLVYFFVFYNLTTCIFVHSDVQGTLETALIIVFVFCFIYSRTWICEISIGQESISVGTFSKKRSFT